MRKSHCLLSLVSILTLLAPSAQARILPMNPIEAEAAKANLIVIAERVKRRLNGWDVVVKEVLHGDTASVGEQIHASGLFYLSTDLRTSPHRFDGPSVSVENWPLLLCLTKERALDGPNKPFEHYFMTTSPGSSVKILDKDKDKVYGYYPMRNSYVLHLESTTRDTLKQKIARGLKLSEKWEAIKATEDSQQREEATMTFLADRTLPPHFAVEASRALSNERLIEIIRDEVEHVQDDPNWQELRSKYTDTGFRSRLEAALLYTKNDGKELLPLLKKIKTARPNGYRLAIFCAARVGGPPAIEFLRDAFLEIRTYPNAGNSASRRLASLKTDESRRALEEGIEALILQAKPDHSRAWEPTLYFARAMPDEWKQFAADLEARHGQKDAVQKYLAHSWKHLVHNKALWPGDIPKRFIEVEPKR